MKWGQLMNVTGKGLGLMVLGAVLLLVGWTTVSVVNAHNGPKSTLSMSSECPVGGGTEWTVKVKVRPFADGLDLKLVGEAVAPDQAGWQTASTASPATWHILATSSLAIAVSDGTTTWYNLDLRNICQPPSP